MFNINVFLQNVYDAINIQSATDLIYNEVDKLLTEGKHSEVNEIMRKADIDKLPTELLRSFLSITFRGKCLLPERQNFYEKSFAKFTQLRGLDKAQKVLYNLK